MSEKEFILSVMDKPKVMLQCVRYSVVRVQTLPR